MAIFKCKMCGGDLNIEDGVTVTVCEYCETKQTIPCLDNEKKLNLFNRANRLRMNSEFDKAAAIYENIVAEFPEEAEAYWGLCLCNYGIEYVDDPATAKKIPTCHRASFESLQNDENFELALEYADVVAQKVYRDEAREIDHIMQEILAVSKNEKPYDVFICYKETDEKGERTIDSVLAHDIYDALTAKGLNVFFSRITLENKLGRQYEPYIFAALNSAKVMLAIGTKYEYYNAVWVKNEWSRFLKLMAKDKSKVLIPCFKDIDAYDIPEEFKNLQAQDMSKLGFIQDLVRGVKKIIGNTVTISIDVQDNPESNSLTTRGYFYLEDNDFITADSYFNRALDINPINSKAYVGKVLAALRLSVIDEIYDIVVDLNSFKDFERAVRFATGKYKEDLEAIKIKSETKVMQKKLLHALDKVKKKKQEEEKRRQQQEKEQQLSSELAEKHLKYYCTRIRQTVSSGFEHVVWINNDGTVGAIGNNKKGQCNVSNWKDIVSVSAGDGYTIGLKSNGTVVSTNNHRGNDDSFGDVTEWTDILSIASGGSHALGLKADGTVVSTRKYKMQEYVSKWKTIVAITAGSFYSVGLTNYGSVEYASTLSGGYDTTLNWFGILEVSSNSGHTVGLKSDGTVVATGSNTFGQCDVSNWADIVSVSAGRQHTVGLKSDGTVVTIGNNQYGQCNVSNWTNIVAVATGAFDTIGFKSDGTVIMCGKNNNDTTIFHDIKIPKREKIEDIKVLLETEKSKLMQMKNGWKSCCLCQYCGGQFKGLFTKKCSICGKEKDY